MARHKDAIAWLKAIFAQKKVEEPTLSLREFARQIGVSSSSLSDMFAGKRQLSKQIGKRIATNLNLHGAERSDFLALVEKKWLANSLEKRRISTSTSKSAYQDVRVDTFTDISDWYYFAIFCLMETSTFQSEPTWIAARLGIEVEVVRQAIARLIHCGLVAEKDGELQATNRDVEVQPQQANICVKKFHKQTLEKAHAAVDNIPREERNISSIYMACDTKKLDQARIMIQNFQRKLSRFLEGKDKSEPSEVHCLSVQLFPLTVKVD